MQEAIPELVVFSLLALHLVEQVGKSTATRNFRHNNLFDKQFVKVGATEVVIALVVNDCQFTLDDLYQRHVEGAATEIV
jgi:hypothetical protein